MCKVFFLPLAYVLWPSKTLHPSKTALLPGARLGSQVQDRSSPGCKTKLPPPIRRFMGPYTPSWGAYTPSYAHTPVSGTSHVFLRGIYAFLDGTQVRGSIYGSLDDTRVRGRPHGFWGTYTGSWDYTRVLGGRI